MCQGEVPFAQTSRVAGLTSSKVPPSEASLNYTRSVQVIDFGIWFVPCHL